MRITFIFVGSLFKNLNLRQLIFFVSFTLFFAIRLEASHIVGGEVTLIHYYRNEFQVTLNMYFDMINGDPGAQDPYAQIAFYDKATNKLLDTIYVPLNSFRDIPNEIGVCNYIKLQTRKLIYTDIILLDSAKYNGPQGFYGVWARCCRNAGIVNIRNPAQAATIFYSEFLPASKMNSSPEFSTPLRNGYACLDIPFVYDFSATDKDGDQLKYELSTPYNGNLSANTPAGWATAAPYAPVVFIPGIDQNNMIPGSVPLQVNPTTGQLKFTGTVPGLFVFTVKCSEYRNGVYIGCVRKDYQLLVIRCARENSKPQLGAINPNTNTVYNPSDNIYINNSKESCISLFANDTVQGQKLSVTYSYSPGFNDPVTISPDFYFTKTNNDTAHYNMCVERCVLAKKPSLTVRIIVANENNCTLPKYDTLTVTFSNKPLNTNLHVSLQPLESTNINLLANKTLNFTVTGSNADSSNISLYVKSLGFALETKKMLFSSVTGTGAVQSPFSYISDCQGIRDSPYKIWFIASDTNCFTTQYDSIMVRINVQDTSFNYNIKMINIITPNGDNVNDFFELRDLPDDNCSEVFSSIDIYNRWGTKVFTDHKRTFKWEPTDITDGIYYYMVKYSNQVLKSWLQVVK